MNKEKITSRMLLLMWFYLITLSILKLIGFNFDIRVDNKRVLEVFSYIDSTLFLKVVIPSLLCIISTNIIYSMCITTYKDNWKIINIYIVIYSILSNLSKYLHTDYLLISLVLTSILFPIILNKGIMNKIHVVEFIVIDSLFSFISLFIRDLNHSYELRDSFVSVVLTLDYYLMLGIYRIKGGSRLCYGLALVPGFLRETKQNLKEEGIGHYLKQSITMIMQRFSTMKLKHWKEKTVDVFLDSWIPVFIVLVCFMTTTYFLGKEVEAIMFIVPIGTIRIAFSDTFHANDIQNLHEKYMTLVCVIISVSAYCLSVYNILPIELSMISGILVAFGIDWIAYIYKDRLLLRLEIKDLKSKVKEKHLVLSEDGILEIFKEFKTPLHYRDYFKSFFIDGIRDVDYFNTIDVAKLGTTFDEQTWRNAKTRFKKKLEMLELL